MRRHRIDINILIGWIWGTPYAFLCASNAANASLKLEENPPNLQHSTAVLTARVDSSGIFL